MKRLIILFGIFGLLFSVDNVNAEECTSQELANYKALADVIKINTEFDDSGIEYGIYGNNIVTIQGLNEELYILSEDDSEGFFPEDMVDGVITKTISSSVDTFYVYASKCPSEKLRTIELSLKKYNLFADYKECDGISGEDLDVCSEYYNGDISYNQFLKKIDEYNKRSSNVSSEDVDSFFDKYGIYLGIGAGILVILIGILIVIRIRKGRLD